MLCFGYLNGKLQSVNIICNTRNQSSDSKLYNQHKNINKIEHCLLGAVQWSFIDGFTEVCKIIVAIVWWDITIWQNNNIYAGRHKHAKSDRLYCVKWHKKVNWRRKKIGETAATRDATMKFVLINSIELFV